MNPGAVVCAGSAAFPAVLSSAGNQPAWQMFAETSTSLSFFLRFFRGTDALHAASVLVTFVVYVLQNSMGGGVTGAILAPLFSSPFLRRWLRVTAPRNGPVELYSSNYLAVVSVPRSRYCRGMTDIKIETNSNDSFP